jgi:hypothetical protein
MKTTTRSITITTYISDVVEDISTEDPRYEEVIVWGDANPVAWQIVLGRESKVFGTNANTYPGGRGRASALERLAVFKGEVERVPSDTIFGWRARFTLEHYGEKGFRGGFFQQFDGTFNRNCIDLDYTPATVDRVIERFYAWCKGGPFETAAILLDGKAVRAFGPGSRKPRTKVTP